MAPYGIEEFAFLKEPAVDSMAYMIDDGDLSDPSVFYIKALFDIAEEEQKNPQRWGGARFVSRQ